MPRPMTLPEIKVGDYVRLRYVGEPNGVAKRYGDTWATVTRDSSGRVRGPDGSDMFAPRARQTERVTVALDAIEGDERRVLLDEIGAVERAGLLIAERRQAPASDADQFPLIYVGRLAQRIVNAQAEIR